jgi:hypothetical protein
MPLPTSTELAQGLAKLHQIRSDPDAIHPVDVAADERVVRIVPVDIRIGNGPHVMYGSLFKKFA